MLHPTVQRAEAAAQGLLDLRLAERATSNAHLIPDVYLSWDETEGEIVANISSHDQNLLALDVQVKRAPRWLSLNIGLGPGAFTAQNVLGLIVDMKANRDLTLEVALFSTHNDELLRTHWGELIELKASQPETWTFHTLRAGEELTWAKDFHTLVISLPLNDFSLDIRDFRFFVNETAPATDLSKAP